MGLLGGSAAQGMQNTYKQNRNLGKKKKSLKETSERYNDVLSGRTFEKRKMTDSERTEHAARMKSYKRDDMIRLAVLFVLVTAAIGGIIYLVS